MPVPSPRRAGLSKLPGLRPSGGGDWTRGAFSRLATLVHQLAGEFADLTGLGRPYPLTDEGVRPARADSSENGVGGAAFPGAGRRVECRVPWVVGGSKLATRGDERRRLQSGFVNERGVIGGEQGSTG
jgi:hypothetical protein